MLAILDASVSGLLSSPLVLRAFVAGALAALVVALLAMLFRRSVVIRVLFAIVAVALGGLGVFAILDRLAQDLRAAQHRALTQRNAELTAQALAPGSALACLDDVAGEAVETACEKAIFAGPQAVAGAVAYVAARLDLLAETHTTANEDDFALISGLRRLIEHDRFGLVAHVLAVRDGCTVERCAAFHWVGDADVIKSNLKAQLFDQYVSRYAAEWDRPAPVAEKETSPTVARSSAPANIPVGAKYDFPSAASIPPVSIMNAEPPLRKEVTDAQAAPPPLRKDVTDAQAAQPPPGEGNVSAPQKRPQTHQAAPPVPR
jgi:hypothetical protein